MQDRLKFVGTNVQTQATNPTAMSMEETSSTKAPKVAVAPTTTRGGFHGRYPSPTDEQKERDNRSVCVRNLDPSVSKELLQQLFSTVGNVILVTLPLTKSGASKEYAYVELDSVEARERAITNLNGTKLAEKEILVEKKRTNIKGFNDRRDPNKQLVVLFSKLMRASVRGGRGGMRRGGPQRGRGGN